MSDTVIPTQKKRHAVGLGFIKGDYRRIVVSFDEEMFSEIYKRARRANTSFAEQVRLLVEWGLDV